MSLLICSRHLQASCAAQQLLLPTWCASAATALQQQAACTFFSSSSNHRSSGRIHSSSYHRSLQHGLDSRAASQPCPTGWAAVSPGRSCTHGFRPRPVTQQHRHQSGATAGEVRRLAQYEFKWVTLPLLYTKQDAYRHPVPLLQELSANSGWKPKLAVLFGRIRDWFQERSARTVMRSNIPGYDKSALPDEIAEIYKQVIKAQADMQPDPIRDLVSKEIFLQLRSQAEQRRRQGWDKVHWEMLDADQLSSSMLRVRSRAVKLLPDSPFNWIQLTYCIISKQRFAAYKTDPKTGRETLVEGDPSKGEEVVEYCVFERKTRQGWSKTPGKAMPTLKMQEALEGSRWRLVAWLDP